MSDSYPHFWEAAWHLALESRDFANPYNTSQLARLFHKIGLLNVGKRQSFMWGSVRVALVVLLEALAGHLLAHGSRQQNAHPAPG